jgi:hypothetical protein
VGTHSPRSGDPGPLPLLPSAKEGAVRPGPQTCVGRAPPVGTRVPKAGPPGPTGRNTSRPRHLIRKDHPLNLSISLSGGEETNQDFPSNGERTGKSPAWKSGCPAPRIVVWRWILCSAPDPSSLERDVGEGDNPVESGPCCSTRAQSTSRAVWECSPKWVVNSIQG